MSSEHFFSHQLIILQFFWAVEDYILHQLSQRATKWSYYSTNYDKIDSQLLM